MAKDKKNIATQFYTVGQLRRLLDGLDDDTFIACQTVSTDGTAWNMIGEFIPEVTMGTISCITFSHKDLKTLNQ